MILNLYRLTYVISGGPVAGTEWTRYLYALDERKARHGADDILTLKHVKTSSLKAMPEGAPYQKTRLPATRESEEMLIIL